MAKNKYYDEPKILHPGKVLHPPKVPHGPKTDTWHGTDKRKAELEEKAAERAAAAGSSKNPTPTRQEEPEKKTVEVKTPNKKGSGTTNPSSQGLPAGFVEHMDMDGNPLPTSIPTKAQPTKRNDVATASDFSNVGGITPFSLNTPGAGGAGVLSQSSGANPDPTSLAGVEAINSYPGMTRPDQAAADAAMQEVDLLKNRNDAAERANRESSAAIDAASRLAAGKKIDAKTLTPGQRTELTGDRIGESNDIAKQIDYSGYLESQGVTPEQAARARTVDTLEGRSIDAPKPEYSDLEAMAAEAEAAGRTGTEAQNILERQGDALSGLELDENATEEDKQAAILERILSGKKSRVDRTPHGIDQAAEQMANLEKTMPPKEFADLQARQLGRPPHITPTAWDKEMVKKQERGFRALDSAAARRNGTTPEVEGAKREAASILHGREKSQQELEQQEARAAAALSSWEEHGKVLASEAESLSQIATASAKEGGTPNDIIKQLKENTKARAEHAKKRKYLLIADPELRATVRTADEEGLDVLSPEQKASLDKYYATQ